jgi:hypothetical protein
MSDAELFELGLINSAQATTMLNAYLTLTFAFILTSYVAGPNLSKNQVWVISILYLIGVIPMIFGNYYFTIRSAEFERMVSTNYQITGVGAWGSGVQWAGFMSFVLVSGAIGSYYFLYSAKRGRDGT